MLLLYALGITGWSVVIYSLIVVWRRGGSYKRRKTLRRQFKSASLEEKQRIIDLYRAERRKYGDYDGTYPG
jgi:hypothetical protein